MPAVDITRIEQSLKSNVYEAVALRCISKKRLPFYCIQKGLRLHKQSLTALMGRILFMNIFVDLSAFIYYTLM